MQLHFARCVIGMPDSTITPTDAGRGTNFQHSGLSWNVRFCATAGEESGSRTRSPGT